ncbi:MAG: WecB/TagA/CpsF family glycosyltransferase [Candidatus Firestonebacteria bacterium]
MKRFKVLGVRVDDISFYETLLKTEEAVKTRKHAHFISLSALTVLTARKDTEFLHIINKASVVNCDGAGVKLAVRLLYGEKIEKVSGIDLLPFICRLCADKGYSVFFFGSTKEAVSGTAGKMKKRFPKLKVAGFLDGFSFSNSVKLVEDLRKAKPDVLFVGLGQPAQEKWIEKYQAAIGIPVSIGVGGSFDVISGKIKRSPRIFQKSGFEWAYRLYLQPWRINRILRLFVFMYLVIIQKISLRRRSR